MVFHRTKLQGENFMGAWGCGIFENDTALDFIYELSEEKDLKSLFKKIFNRVVKADYLDQDEGCNVLVAGALINSINNKDKYVELFEEYNELMKKIQTSKLTDLVDDCLASIKIAISEKSELKELWEESDYFDEWKNEVLELHNDLEKSYKK